MEEAADAAASIGTGALLAREVERAHAPGHDRSGACANCGTVLTGPFCSTCGQRGHVHRTVGALFHDLVHGVFHFEGKLWATLPLLAWRPGELTRRYVHGERASFVSPVALFLFSVFLLFAVLSNLPNLALGDNAFGGNRPDVAAMRERMIEEERKATARVGQLERRLKTARAETPVNAAVVNGLVVGLAKAREDQATLAQAGRLLPTAKGTLPDLRSADSWLQQKYQKAKQNPKLLVYKMKTSAYKWSWALIPLSLPFIWLLFPLRRNVGLYDHAIFATYSLSFMSLLMVMLGLLNWAGVPGGGLILVAMIVPVIHIYRQLRGAYRLSRLGAVWRTWLMLWFIAIIVPLFGVILLYLGVAD
jgi:hypothetical protein